MLQSNGGVKKTIKSVHAWLVCTALILALMLTAPVVSAQSVANAGPDQVVRQGSTVNLDGSASFFPSGVTPNYLWNSDDASISLLLVSGVSPTFTAPSGFEGSDRVIEIALLVIGRVNISVDTVRITVRGDVTLPVITLTGANPQTIERGTTYTDLGAMAMDNIDGDITSSIVTTGTVDTDTVGSYTVTYNVMDAAGNVAVQVTRTVTVTPDATAPVITLTGEAAVSIELGTDYTDAGATAVDNINGDITSEIVIAGDTVDTATVGSYTVTYNVMDTAGNAAAEVTRTVTVLPARADAGPDQVVRQGSTVNLDGSASFFPSSDYLWDPDDTSIALSFTNIVNPTFTAPSGFAGDRVIDITLTVIGRTISTDTVRITVMGDAVKPVITLNGEASVSIERGTTYTDLGAMATDNIDGDITSSIVTAGTVDTATVGSYTVTYNVMDTAGNAAAEVTRTVTVTADVTLPVITLTGEAAVSIELGTDYSDAGATARDNTDGDITSAIVITGTVDTDTVGSYTIRYNVMDAAGNAAAEVTRTVTVTPDATAPVISLRGEAAVSIELGTDYTDAGATAQDNINGDITSEIVIAGDTVNTDTVGSYTITYNVMDTAGNAAAEVTRTVTVTADVTLPVITLTGANPQTIERGTTYAELGAMATDNIDGDITSSIVVAGDTVNTATVGSYTVTYNVMDAAGNAAVQVTRTVTVKVLLVRADAGPDQVVRQGSTVNLDGSASFFPSGVPSNYLWDPDDSSIALALVNGVSPTFTAPSGFAGDRVIEITLIVVGAAGDLSSDTVRITVMGDAVKPVITLNGEASVSIERGTTYVEPGAMATDNIDGDITGDIVVAGDTVDTATVGSYTVTYNVMDAAGNAAVQVTRTVTVTPDATAPVISLRGDAAVSIELGTTYSDAGATAQDNIDGTITANIVTAGTVNTAMVGSYTVTYNVMDAANNAAAEVTRTVTVTPDATLPVISLLGEAAVSIELGATYSDAGATAQDNIDGTITANIVTAGTVNTATVGSYIITYNVMDAAGNAAAEVTRTVTVTADATLPVISLLGEAAVSIELGATYSDAGATAQDNIDGTITANIVTAGTVNTATAGSYIITYNVMDAAGNAANAVTRTVTVTADVTLPVITLTGANPQTIERGTTYAELGAMATDNIDGDITSSIVVAGDTVNTDTVGSYTVTYNVMDAAGNAAVQVTRTVTVTVAVLLARADAGPDQVVRQGSTVNLDGSASVFPSSVTPNYLWNSVDASISLSLVNGVSPTFTAPSGFEGSDRVIEISLLVIGLVNISVDTVRITVRGDVTLPVITLTGANPQTIERGTTYTDLGAMAMDNIDGDITSSIVVAGDTVDTATVDSYTVTYNVMDAAGNVAVQVTRTVTVTADVTLPVITLTGANPQTIERGTTYTDLGAMATDNIDGDITSSIVTAGTVDTATVGSYTVTYNVMDAANNAAAEVTRTVTVTPDATAPVISLRGDAAVSIELGTTYSDAGATAQDNIDGTITANIVTAGTVNTATVGSYIITYNVMDAAGNAAAEVTRTVTVTADATLPVISLLGEAAVSIELGATYSDAGATAQDNIDGTITANIVTAGTVNTATVGSYIITYNVMDTAGNAAAEVTRTVTVTADVTLPVITLTGANPQTIERGTTYAELGAMATDNIDGDITSSIVVAGDTVNTDTAGSYTVTYNVMDAAGNAAVQVTRTVTVKVLLVRADAGPDQVVRQGSTVNLDGSASFFPSGVPSNYLWDPDDSSIALALVNGVSPTFTAPSGFAGDRVIEITLIVVGAAGDLSSDTVRITVMGDAVKPVITLNGEASVSIERGTTYVEPGAMATDNIDGDITGDIVVAGDTVDTATVGSYTVTYNVMDAAGNAAVQVTRTVTVTPDATAPVISLRGDAAVSIELGTTYSDAGATAQDNIDGTITANIVTAGTVNTAMVGSYTVTYNVMDAANNAAAEVTRTVTVTPDATLPVISLLGEAAVSIELGATYSDAGATAQDNIDGTITANIVTAGTVNTATVGSYIITYNVMDAAGNAAAEVTRTVTVTADATLPVITLTGANPQTIERGTTYAELGAMATDNIDGDITSSIVVAGDTVNTDTAGSYTVTYNVMDAAGNAAVQVTRTVTVKVLLVRADAGPDQVVRQGSTVNLDGSASFFPSGVPSNYLWDPDDSSIALALVNGVSPTFTAPSGFAGDRVIEITLIVVGAAGDLSSDTVRITVMGDAVKPVITLTGEAAISIELGATYSDAGATAQDNIDGTITANIVTAGTVNTATAGSYIITYNVMDAAGNAAAEVTRTVTVTPDATAPVISLRGDAAVSIELGTTYSDAGATAQDNIDGTITANIVTAGTVNTATAGSYIITYNVMDAAGNAAAEVTRTVTVTADATLPVITLTGEAAISIELGATYSDAGATAQDNIDGTITANIVTAGTVNTATAGSYIITYNVMDAAGNAAAEVTRTVTVTADATLPVISLLGEAAVSIELGATYSDAGATAQDNIDGTITANIVTAGTVNTATAGSYIITYNVMDAAGNAAAEVTRTVTVTADATLPVISLLGEAAVSIELGATYSDAGATAQDNIDGTITANIVTAGTVNTATAGSYIITYNVMDAAGNAAAEVTRTVTVTADATLPVISLLGEAAVSIELGATYSDAGATAQDNIDGTITANIVTAGTVNTATAGSYIITYNVMDAAGNAAMPVTRTVTVTADATLPVISLTGEAAISIELGATYSDAGATAQDNIDGTITANIVTAGTVNTATAGSYIITYNVMDAAGNAAAEVTRTVTVTADATLPVISLLGEAAVSIELGATYSDAGATAQDNIDGTITANIVTAGTVNTATAGSYIITYNVMDAAGNAAAEVTRTVTVTADATLPVISLLGEAAVSIELGATYSDAGATAQDNIDGTITANIVTAGTVNTATAGSYIITYNVMDAAGNAAAEVTRTVTVTADATLPVITLTGEAAISIELGATYSDAGATAQDNIDGTITANIVTAGTVNTATAGSYIITYNVMDTAGNAAAEVTRTVTVTADATLPVISLLGEAAVSIELGATYSDAGATAQDNIDGTITANIVTAGTVNTATAGSYIITYNVMDAAGNAAAEVTRTVTVTADATLPVISLLGEAAVSIELGATYSDAGATAQDNIDGTITANIVTAGTVNTATAGSYIITYNVMDAAGNAAAEVTRTVTVTADATLPVISLLGEAAVSIELGATYSDAGATAQDNIDGTITANIVTAGTVNTATAGSYIITYNVMDAAGNAAAEVTRTVTVTADATLPVISLLGEAAVSIELGATYSDAGATAQDNIDGTITANIVTAGTVNTATAGSYIITYNVMDAAGNAAAEVTRTVTVTADATLPVISLLGEAAVSIELGATYSDAGATAQDNIDGTITANIVTAGTVNTATAGSYIITYNVMDAAGNAAMPVTRTVTVTADATLPVISLTGEAAISIELGATYSDAGATAQDNIDGTITANIVTAGTVNTATAGSYIITYNVMDAAGNAAAEVTRTVTVTADATLPVISLLGEAAVSIELGATYSDAGATAQDNIDGTITANIVTAGTVNTATAGSYIITYNVMDAAGNAAAEVTRTVTVTADATLPVISLLGEAAVSIELGATYSDAGATAQDNIDGTITANIVTAGTVNTATAGSYIITYNVMDAAGNAAAEVTRTVTVTADATLPVITLTGEAAISIELGATYSDAGATAQDNIDGTITANIVTAGTVNTATAGSYIITYNVMDTAGNAAAEVTRTVTVTADATLPVISLLGEAAVSIELGATYSDAGATAQDNIDGTITANIVTAGTVNTATAGSYIITYNVMDAAGNAAAEVTRTVTVTADATLPVISLLGEAAVSIELGATYSDAGATAQDNIDGTITANIVTAGTVNTATAGSYIITYNVMDAAGNAAAEVTRTVTVTADVTAPVITLTGEARVSIKPGTVYSDAGATAQDNTDGDITSAIVSTGTVNTAMVGSYIITYNVRDAANNAAAEVTRTVTVTADATLPVISLLGEAAVSIELGATYSDAGATAQDNIDGTITANIVSTGTVNTAMVGSYIITYNVRDAANNAAAEVTRTVTVTTDTTLPVISLTGEAAISIELGTVYTDTGATAVDNIDGDITTNIVTAGTVNTAMVGSYIITYNVMDAAGNAANAVTRTVTVTADTTLPVITLTGEAAISIELGATYSDAGATAQDNIDGTITANIVTAGTVNTATAGSYIITYNVMDAAGNAAAEVTRTVTVTADMTAPVITLTGEAAISIELGATYSDAGATAQDNIDGTITANIVTAGTVNTATADSYIITYNVMDAAGNAAAEVTRTVTVTADATLPVISLLGEAAISIELGATYSDAGATAQDNIDGTITANIVTAGTVNTATAGSYIITYNVMDAAGNAAAEVTRTVTVTADATLPVITLTGEAAISIELGATYSDAGATAQDNIDGTITANIVTAGTVNTATAGSYIITYNVMDAAGNAAAEVTRTVTVTADATLPVITLTGEAAISIELGATYSDAGATAQDNIDGTITANIVTAGTVNTATAGSYIITYNVMDAAGNAANAVMRTVTVTADATLPVISLLGEAAVSIELGATYSDAGATAQDNIDGTITANIVTAGTVNTATAGSYIITYNVMDAAGNAAAEVARTVTVTAEAEFTELNTVILPEMARAMVDQTVSAITQRIDQTRSGGTTRSVAIAGQSTLAGAASAHGQAIADGTLSLKDVLGNSDFVLPLSNADNMSNGMLSSLTFWGGGGYRSLKGSGGEDVNFDGDLFSAHLGLDAQPRDDLLIGLAVSWSQSDLGYRELNRSGDYELDLTSVNPYVSWEALAGQLDLWATAGYGWGDLEITDDGRADSDVSAWNVAVGGNIQLLQRGPARFRLKSSALLTELEVEGSDDIEALEVESSLLRMILEGSYKHTLTGGAYVEPSIEAGVRYDGGDGETGLGAELGASLRYIDPIVGLTLEGKVHALVGRDNYEEWGVSGLILLERGRNGRGLSFSLSPGYGNTNSGTQKVWQEGLFDEVSGDQGYSARLDTRLGYGLTAPGGRGLLTPYSEMTFGGSSKSYRLGLRWELDALFDLNLTGERRESNRGDTADHAIMLKGDIRF